MQITLSFATTADGYLDDNSPRRLMISTPEDWEAVLRLRASHDAILAGAETLRRDDPALLLRDAAARELRRARGMRPDLTKVHSFPTRRSSDLIGRASCRERVYAR